MKFKELENDVAFVFAAERNIPGYQGMRGPWAKVDKRSYCKIGYNGQGIGVCYKVGTINVDVERF